jgi:hypothetical protein
MSVATSRGRAFRIAACWAVLSAVPAFADPPAPPAADQNRPDTRFEKDRLYLYRVTDFSPLKAGGGDRDVEHQAYCDLALHAHGFRAADLLTAARKDVSHADLMAKNDVLREDVRFELIRLDGRLKRLKRIGTYPELQAAGIADRYEAWVFPTDTDNPVCVHLTEAPAGVEPADDVTPGRRVTVAGFFFKVIRYESAEPNPKKKEQNLIRQAPLLVGRALVVDTTPEPVTDGNVLVKLLPAVLAGGAVLVLLLVGLSVWLRRTDRGTRAYAAKRDRNPFAGPPPEPPAAPERPEDRA